MTAALRLTRGHLVPRRFMRLNLAVCALCTLLFMSLLALSGPYLNKHKWNTLDFMYLLQPPSREHWFGTTQIGGDVFALTMRGLQKSLIIGLLVAFFSTGIAAIVGAFAGYLGGKIDKAMMWVVDLLLVLPAFFLADTSCTGSAPPPPVRAASDAM